MSNIKEIDGVFVNLDNLTFISADDVESNTNRNRKILICFKSNSNEQYGKHGKIEYATFPQAESRIKQILKNQSSDKDKI